MGKLFIVAAICSSVDALQFRHSQAKRIVFNPQLDVACVRPRAPAAEYADRTFGVRRLHPVRDLTTAYRPCYEAIVGASWHVQKPWREQLKDLIDELASDASGASRAALQEATASGWDGAWDGAASVQPADSCLPGLTPAEAILVLAWQQR